MTATDLRLAALAELGHRIGAATGVEEVVDLALAGSDELLGLRHSLLLVHQVESDRLVTLASHGYDELGIGSEVRLGQGVIGMAAERRRSMRIGNLQRMLAYALATRPATADRAGTDIRLPGLRLARSQLAAPMCARGTLVGVIAVESERALAFDEADEQALTVVAHLVAAALEREQAGADAAPAPGPADRAAAATPPPEGAGTVAAPAPGAPQAPEGAAAQPPAVAAPVHLRHYAADGSTFLDGDYVIKGVAGRLLWKVASEHTTTGRTAFTNREARLDPTLELPPYRDNFESRLILLKRRLEEQGSPLRIVGTGRGRFELRVAAPLCVERVEA